jgi:pyruvate ferredoxin oxidoreductase alpha subunit/phenylglyoxylate dehydrogenase alpha subunit
MKNAKDVVCKADALFKEKFGRSYGGLIENYRCDNADFVTVTLGSMTGAAKEAADMARQAGVKAGVLKIKCLRPFPVEAIRALIRGKKALAVVDRDVSFGFGTGIVYQEIRSAAQGERLALMPYIGGLGGEDLTVQMFSDIISDMQNAHEDAEADCIWLSRRK